MLLASVSNNASNALPDASPQEQYEFALRLLFNNDLEAVEAAFTEYVDINPDDERGADALYWAGRVQYQRGQYERAAITFSEFSRIYPDDPRIVDGVLHLAKAVSQFAPAEQACTIYTELPNLLVAPTKQLTLTLNKLFEVANCIGRVPYQKSVVRKDDTRKWAKVNPEFLRKPTKILKISEQKRLLQPSFHAKKQSLVTFASNSEQLAKAEKTLF